MKEILIELAAYNTWATQKLVDTILLLPEEKQNAELKSSFSSLHKTIFHMWDAESIWWQRLKLQEKIVRPSELYSNGSFKETADGLLKQSMQWQEWVGQASVNALEHVFHYMDTKREQFKQPVYQMLVHVFNHGTYHRGQLITMLHQLGVEKLPGTDFVTWTRIKK